MSTGGAKVDFKSDVLVFIQKFSTSKTMTFARIYMIYDFVHQYDFRVTVIFCTGVRVLSSHLEEYFDDNDTTKIQKITFFLVRGKRYEVRSLSFTRPAARKREFRTTCLVLGLLGFLQREQRYNRPCIETSTENLR